MARALKCPKCGGKLSPVHPPKQEADTLYRACTNCGTVFRVKIEEVKLRVQKTHEPKEG